MRGRPFLVAFAAFVIVLLGGAAMAGIGTHWDVGSSSAAPDKTDDVQATPTTSVPKATTTTIVAEEPEPEPITRDKPVQQESEEAKEAEPAKEADTDKDVQEPVPVFALTHPEDGARFKSKVVVFGGTADEGVIVHRGKYEAVPDRGEWSMELVLSPGKNHVSFEGVDQHGNKTVASVTVFYDAPQEKDTVETAPFVAHQKYGSCGEDVPYDVFYGSAEPGAKITAGSAYGGNSTTANEKGKWEMEVTFPDAPSGKTFNVKVKASTGQSKTFSFTNTGEGKNG